MRKCFAFRYLPHQTILLVFRACQLSLSSVSGMNRQRLISLLPPPSSSLLPAIIPSLSLTAPITDWLLTACPVLIGFPLPPSLSLPLTLSVGGWVPRVLTIKKGVSAKGRVQETRPNSPQLTCGETMRGGESVMRNIGFLQDPSALLFYWLLGEELILFIPKFIKEFLSAWFWSQLNIQAIVELCGVITTHTVGRWTARDASVHEALCLSGGQVHVWCVFILRQRGKIT